MFDYPAETEDTRPSAIRRMLADPLRLRRQTIGVLIVSTLVAGLSRLIDGWPGAILMVVPWVAILPIAFGMAVGDAFLVAHGRARRRLLLTMTGAVVIALASCVLLAIISEASDSVRGDVTDSVMYAVFYGANVIGLSALIAFIIGRGGDYVSRRIDVMSNDDW